MSLRLILLRHAKSSWDDPLVEDHDRPLNPRGRAAAPVIGRWLAGQGYRPDRVLVSSATRARQTWEGLAGALDPAPAPEFLPALYHASPDRMLAVLRRQAPGTLLLIGHNPGLAGLAALLLAHPPAHAAFDRFPTAATLVADFPVDDWSALRPGTGRTEAFITPRDLS